jgi:K+-sensing histidine kinase KdpD
MARLEETDRIRTDLVASVSHEFRAPLAAIQGTLSKIKRDRGRMPDAQFNDLVESTARDVTRLSRLLENMLTASTASAIDEDEGAVTDLVEVVTDILAGLRSSAAANSVIVDLPAQVPVRMAGQALHQVVANLVDNAITHSWPGAPVRLIAGHVGDEVVLRIRNPGPDLDPATIHRLFEPFTSRGATATREAAGIGMGLYVVRRLVEVHGGRLRMQSRNGEIIVEVDLCAAPQPSTAAESAPTHPLLRPRSRQAPAEPSAPRPPASAASEP